MPTVPPMTTPNNWLHFILREWLLLAAASGLILTSVHLHRLPVCSAAEYEVLFILFVLFVAVKGLEKTGLLSRLSAGIEKGSFIPLKLVLATFLLSMVVTNDVALIVIVPLTLALRTRRKDILVILEALAANAGSALTPIGNPQNLFIYWFYSIRPQEFVLAIAPLSVVFLFLLAAASLLVKTPESSPASGQSPKVERLAPLYGVLLVIAILSVFHVLPMSVDLLVILCALVLDRRSLRVDYPLLLTFFCFFGLTENLEVLLAAELENSRHIFLASAAASQIMSNVPGTILFAKFTRQWKALLWGANVGAFGSLVGSLANLIAYKLYVTDGSTENPVSFTTKFLVLGYLMFFIGIGLYWAVEASL